MRESALNIDEFLRSTRVVEMLDVDSDPMYRDFRSILSSVLPDATLVAMRSASADVFGIRCEEKDYVVWDDTYATTGLVLAHILRTGDGELARRRLAIVGFEIIAAFLFDEGLYLDAWIAASIADLQKRQLPADPLEAEESQDDSLWRITSKAALLFLFVHETAHIGETNRLETYTPYRDAVEEDAFLCRAALRTMPAARRRAFLRGEEFSLFESEGPVPSSSMQGISSNLLSEATADRIATETVFLHVADPMRLVDVAESLTTFELAMELIGGVRERMRRAAIDVIKPPRRSNDVSMRSLLLRHTVVHELANAVRGTEGAEHKMVDFLQRHRRLIFQRDRLWGHLSEDLVTFVFTLARRFRVRIRQASEVFAKGAADWEEEYRRSFLRLRGWLPPSDNGMDFLDQIPGIINSTLVHSFETIKDKFDISVRVETPDVSGEDDE